MAAVTAVTSRLTWFPKEGPLVTAFTTETKPAPDGR
jgi:hypothetical protein